MAANNGSKTPLSEAPLLDTDQRSESSLPDYSQSQWASQRKKSWLRRNIMGIAFHGLMAASYLYLAILFTWKSTSTSQLLFTPVKDYIQHEVIVIPDSPSDIQKSAYVGPPSPETDAAWYRLLRYHNIRVTDEELETLNQTSIPLGHGGGYQAMMGVFHELHCLKLIREAVHKDYYYKDKSETVKAILVGHTEHCIDILRAGSMCRADTAIFTYHWNDATRFLNPTWKQQHQCVKWDRLEEWLETRRIDIREPGLLVHPKYGASYPS